MSLPLALICLWKKDGTDLTHFDILGHIVDVDHLWKWNMPLWLQVQELSGLLALASAAHQQLKDLKWELGSQKHDS